MNAKEALKLSTEAAEPSKEVITYIFDNVKKEAMKGNRYATVHLSNFALSGVQVNNLIDHLRELGYSLTSPTKSERITFYTIRW